MSNKKKKVLINSDYILLKTGLARNAKELAIYLHNTGKYEVILYCCGMQWDNPDYQRLPFKCVGTLPNNPQELEQINRDQGYARACAYGVYYIDRAISEFKPDILINSNDSWGGADNYMNKPWWNKIHCIPHITIDSLPLLPNQIELAKKSKQMFVWADFAEKEYKRLGFNNVETLTGIIRPDSFFKLTKKEKIDLRKKYNLPIDSFITGFVFRNQLRKELRSLMEGYALFKKDNPTVRNTYLLLHTHWSEPAGWDIHRFCDEFNIPKKEILTTYICRSCGEIEIKDFTGQDVNCRFCNAQKSQITCNVGLGATEKQLNYVYNLMDAYCHPQNASGLEMPMCEALYCELPLATNGYAAGETFTNNEFVYNIDFAWTVQLGTQFRRAAPYGSSVAKFLKRIYYTTADDRAKIGKKGREWAISKFGPEVVCKQWEEYLDSLPPIDWDYNFTPEPKNPNAIIPNIEDNDEWILTLYKEILKMNIDKTDGGFVHWTNSIKAGMKRQDIENYFRKVAADDNNKNQPQQDFSVLLDKNDENNRILYIMPESLGDCFLSTAIFKSLKEQYSDCNLYVATKPENFEIFEGNPYVFKVIPYLPQMDNQLWLEGQGGHKGYFRCSFHPYISTQRILNYVHNGKDNMAIDLKY